MEITKNCNNCDNTFSRGDLTCGYCEHNPTLVTDNFKPKVPKINKQSWDIEFTNFNSWMKKGFNWDIEDVGTVEGGSYPVRNLVIYLEDIILTRPLAKSMGMLSWETCKQRVSENYNLPMELT